MEFEKKAETIKALQFDGSDDSARAIYKMLDDLADRRGYIKSFRLTLQRSVTLSDPLNGPVLEVYQHQADGPFSLHVYGGDWVVLLPNGKIECMPDRNFRALYQPKERS